MTPRSMATGFSHLVLGFLLVTAIGYFENKANHRLWSASYDVSLIIPFVAVLGMAWCFGVPKHFLYDEQTLLFTGRLGSPRELPWADLLHWGNFGGTGILLQFREKTVGTSLSFYTQESKDELLRLLRTKFPEKRATIWFADRAIR